MQTTVPISADAATSPRSRSRAVRLPRVTAAGVAVGSVGLVALHVLDDNFLQPNPGMSAGDHLVGGSIQLAVLAGVAALYGRVRAGARGAIALLLGFLGVLASAEAVYYTSEVGPSGDDYTGLLAIPAGLTLLGVGAVTLWRSRKTNDRLWWRYGRRGLVVAAVVVDSPVPLERHRTSRTSSRTLPGHTCPRRSWERHTRTSRSRRATACG